MTSRSTVELSANLTISVVGKPAFTTTSTAHQESASGGTAVKDLMLDFRSGRLWLRHHAHGTTKCPCVSHASASACFMTRMDDGAKSIAQTIRSKRPAF